MSAPERTTQTTQGNIGTRSIRPPEIVHRLSFSSETVKRLTGDDFDLNSKEHIGLKYDDCILVLFHVENTESYQLADIWALAAQQVAGPIFAAINMLSERKVAEAFTRLKSDGNNPLHWAALRQYPFIMVYRRGWPTAVYNGPREVQAIIDYALTLACEAGYYEILQTGGSMQSETRIEMGPYQPYIDIPGQSPRIRRDSLQYSSAEPIRGFNPNIPIEITGSTGARQATAEIRAEEARQQQAAAQGSNISLTQQEEATPVTERITTEPRPVGPPIVQPRITSVQPGLPQPQPGLPQPQPGLPQPQPGLPQPQPGLPQPQPGLPQPQPGLPQPGPQVTAPAPTAPVLGTPVPIPQPGPQITPVTPTQPLQPQPPIALPATPSP